MKKILLFILATMLCLSLVFVTVGCNRQIFDTNYTFTKAYIKIGDTWADLEISSWCDYEGEQLQLKLRDGTVMVVNSMNCILYNGTLPKRIEGS